MTKTVLDPVLQLVQQIAEQDIMLRAVDKTDNQGEPCRYCVDDQIVNVGRNMVTLHGFGPDGERGTADCCIRCIPAVASEWFSPLYAVVAEVAR
jgi:hypothetical protein